MAKKPKALTRKITRKRALSYDRMSANGRGVTAMSEVNGDGAYAKRYARTRRMLDSKGKPVTKSSFVRSQMAKGRSKKQAESTWRMRQNAPKAKRPTSRKRKGASRRSAPAKRARRASGTKRASGTMSPNLRRGGERVLKSDFIAQQVRNGRTQKQAEATWRMVNKTKKKSAARAKKGRTYGGKKRQYKALKAKAGRGKRKATKWTYLYQTKTGRARKIPDWALMGYDSAAQVARIQRTGSEQERERLARRSARLFERRARAADKAEQRALQGKAWFSPNAGDDVQTFEEWSKMKRNARSSKKRGRVSSKRPKSKAAFMAAQKRKGRSKKQAEAAWRLTWGQAYKKKGRKASTKRKSPRRRASTKARTTRRKTARKRRTTTKRRTTSRKRKRTTKRKRSTTRRVKRDSAGRRITPKRRAAARRNLKKACRSVRSMKANKRGSYKSRKRRTTSRKRRATPNRKRKTTRKRRGYRANAKGAAYKTELMNSMKFGAIVLGGFLTHRVLTNVLDKYALSKVEALSTGGLADWRKSIAGAIVAAIGIPLTVRMLPKHAGVAAAGMAASLLYEVILTGLKKAKQPELLEAVSAYPDAPGYAQYSGMGSYYTYDTHQVYGAPAMGSYYETQYVPGLEQAAAGMGQDYLMQAAAGMGAPQLSQMYANPMGEYYATGAEGIGEYESYAGGGGMGGYIDDGIMPNTHSAEQMLDVAEAAAGVGNYDNMLSQAAAGFGDLPLEQIVTPNIRAMDIPDQPGGSRAGILAGGDGIFG